MKIFIYLVFMLVVVSVSYAASEESMIIKGSVSDSTLYGMQLGSEVVSPVEYKNFSVNFDMPECCVIMDSMVRINSMGDYMLYVNGNLVVEGGPVQGQLTTHEITDYIQCGTNQVELYVDSSMCINGICHYVESSRIQSALESIVTQYSPTECKDVPEFGAIGAIFACVGAVGIVLVFRRKGK